MSYLSANTKGKLLLLLKNNISIFNIPRLRCISVSELDLFMNNEINEIPKMFNNQNIVIRSSAADEDSQTNSSAGEYASILDVPSDDTEQIITSINKVIASYERKRPLLRGDEIIIQEMVQNTTMSGVIFTHDLNTGAPYYVINYDDKSGTTDSVTSGNSEHANRILYVHRKSINKLRSDRFAKLLKAVQELELVMESQFLDIEFALDTDLTPYLLQVRSITTQPRWNRVATNRIDETLKGVQSLATESFKKISGVYGETTVLGQMPDWNPVEMIGRAPRALSASLYQFLITNHAWSDAREIMGYAAPIGHPLMLMLAGQPFIDTRLSFQSYLPENISSTIAEKLVNHWVAQLKKSPELHDKIEFEVAITTFSFDIDEKIEELVSNVLTAKEKAEFKQAHLNQTMRLIKGENMGSLNNAFDKIESLKKKQKTPSSLPIMLNDCIELGTIPFSILARHGFIAKTILLSLKQQGIITKDEVSQMQASFHTVAGEFVEDLKSMQEGVLCTTDFMEKYGHLRPGTYDIMLKRYDQMTDFSSEKPLDQSLKKLKPFVFSKVQKNQINNLLNDCGFGDFNSNELLNYINQAIVGREYSKFVFTRSVSDIIELIAQFAEENGLTRNEISHVPLNEILNILKNSDEINITQQLREISEVQLQKHDVSVAIRLPQLLADQAGVYVIPFQVNQPNFITNKQITGPSLILCSDIDSVSLSGKIVIIEGADPGFDWIFSQKIAGLITKYGGANSHMAIRCAEFGIPAAIGCGDQIFETLLKTKKIYLDCAAGLINSIH
jgi:phosphohistidine swiveling domain-containing protein